MTHKENIRKTLAHQDGAKVTIDFGGTAVTGMHCSCVAALRDHYGLEKRLVKIHEPYQMLGLLEDDLLDAMGVGVVGLFPPKTLFGFPNQNWKDFLTPWGQTVLVPEDFNVTRDDKGDVYMYPQGDTTAPASAHLPSSSYFFDTIVRQAKLPDPLNPADNLEEFTTVSEEDIAYLEKEAARFRDSDRAVVATLPGMAFGDIALVPAPFLKHPQGIRDISEWYMATLAEPDYIHAIFSRQCELALDNLPKIYAALGESVDVVFLCGTDFGTQSSTFCSTDTFDELYKPYYRQVNDWIHTHTAWKTMKHSCGAVAGFMPHFIDAGFDIINPVQCSASGMEPEMLKREFGADLVFWGGGVDTQQTLPFGTPEEVRAEVLTRCKIFSAQGGFVFDAIHNVQAQTPVENIVAMLEAVKEFNGE